MFYHVFYNELHKKTVKNNDKRDKSKIERSFEIHCVMNNFEVSNDLLQRRHLIMFKNNDFYFPPQMT